MHGKEEEKEGAEGEGMFITYLASNQGVNLKLREKMREKR